MTDPSFTIFEATAGNLRTIIALLAHESLRTEDVLAPGTRFWLAVNNEQVPIGAIGAEYGGDAVLLRSAVVLSQARGQGVGTALVQHLLAEARRQGYRRAYLFSTDAGPYWRRCGFYEVPVPELLAALPHAPQVRLFGQLGWLPTEVAYRLDL